MCDLSRSYGVIGDPVEHSVSPRLHQTIYTYLHLPYFYDKIHVPSHALEHFIQECREYGRPGFNVTLPHKEAIVPLLDEVDMLAERTGAVNTVLQKEGKLIGFNTDVAGCCKALTQEGWIPRKKAILLGAGGAARAAVEALSALGLETIVLFDLDKSRAEKLKNDFHKFHLVEIEVGTLTKETLKSNFKETDLVINATPVGMWPNVHQSPLPWPELIPQNATVFDMVPNPVITRFLKEAKQKKATTISGLHMLIAQGMAAQEIWLARKLPEELKDHIWKNLIQIMENNGSFAHTNRRRVAR